MPAKKTAKRYTADEKANIIAFVEKFNADNGRGGQTAAVKKFGVTPLTLGTWLKKSGKKPSKKGAAKATKKFRNPGKLIERLSVVSKEIEKAEKSLSKLNSEAKLLRKEIRAAID